MDSSVLKDSAGRDMKQTNPVLEAELDRVRTEGDVALFRIQADRKTLQVIEQKIESMEKEIQQQQRQNAQNPPNRTHMDVIAIRKPQRQSLGSDKRQTKSHAEERRRRRMEKQENHSKQKVSTKNAELRTLRENIDSERRIIFDEERRGKLLHNEAILKQQALERYQGEISALQKQQRLLKEEITALLHAYRAEKTAIYNKEHSWISQLKQVQRGSAKNSDRMHIEAEKGSRPEIDAFKSQLILARKKPEMPMLRKQSLEDERLLLQHKQQVLQQILALSDVTSIDQFIARYNNQEKIKTEIYDRVQALSLENAELKKICSQNSRITTKNPSLRSSSHASKQAADADKVLEVGQAQIAQLGEATQRNTRKLHILSDPIQELCRIVLRQNETNADTAQCNAGTILQRLARIEEHVVQHLMSKIHSESENNQQSDTLKRYRIHRGLERK